MRRALTWRQQGALLTHARSLQEEELRKSRSRGRHTGASSSFSPWKCLRHRGHAWPSILDEKRDSPCRRSRARPFANQKRKPSVSASATREARVIETRRSPPHRLTGMGRPRCEVDRLRKGTVLPRKLHWQDEPPPEQIPWRSSASSALESATIVRSHPARPGRPADSRGSFCTVRGTLRGETRR